MNSSCGTEIRLASDSTRHSEKESEILKLAENSVLIREATVGLDYGPSLLLSASAGFRAIMGAIDLETPRTGETLVFGGNLVSIVGRITADRADALSTRANLSIFSIFFVDPQGERDRNVVERFHDEGPDGPVAD